MLPSLVRPNNVDAVEVVHCDIRVPNLVQSSVGDLRGVDEGLAARREHGIVEVEFVSCPNDVHVTFAVRNDGGLFVGCGSTVDDLDGFGDDHGVGANRNACDQQRRHNGQDH